MLSSIGFEPHGHCFLWSRGLLWLYASADSLTALAYYAIPVALISFARKRDDLAFRGVFFMFGAFVFACGTTHLLGVWTLWQPDYWIDGALRGVTAVLSLATVALVFPLVPKALALPSTRQLDGANRRLREQIAEREEAEARTRESEERFLALVAEVTDHAIILLDPHGAVMGWNAGAARVLGYREEEVLGRHGEIFYPEEERVARTPEQERIVAEGEGRWQNAGWRVRKDGSRFWAHVVTTAMRDGAGRLRGFSKVVRDMTEQRRAQQALEDSARELESARELLARKERLAVMGQLAGGLSHELRTPLSVIKNAVFYLKMALPDDEKVGKHLTILERQVQSANRIITSMLDFARTTPGRRLPTDLNHVVREVLERTPVLPTIEVRRALDENLGKVLVDREHVELVLGNLLTNAVEAMAAGGTLTVETARAGEEITLSVVDTGCGIPSEHCTKIFEPLFSTKPKGLGLGLAVVQGLTEMNGGRVAMESAPGRGSRFTLHFAAAVTEPGDR